MESIKQRVDEVRRTLGMTQAAFADSIGMTQSGYATLIKREGPTQRKGKGLKILTLAIEAAHGIRHQWLLTGEGDKQTGEVTRLDDADRTLLKLISDGRFVAPEDRNEAIFNLVRSAIQRDLLLADLRYTSMLEMLQKRKTVSKDELQQMQQNLDETNDLRLEYENKLLQFREQLRAVDFNLLLLDVFARFYRLESCPLKLLEGKVEGRKVKEASDALSGLLDKARQLTRPDENLRVSYNKFTDEELERAAEEFLRTKGWSIRKRQLKGAR